MPDLRISDLPAIAAGSLTATDPVALADLSAAETKKVTLKDLIQGGIPFIDDGSIPGIKVSGGLPPGSVGTTELANDAVTALKLADQSTLVLAATPPATGGYVGQLFQDTTDDKVYAWNGSSWVPVKAAGSINSLVEGTNAVLELTIVITGDSATITPSFKATTGRGEFAAGPAGSGGAVTMRRIASDDLPRATSSAVGGVSAPVGGGLRIEDPSAIGTNANVVIDNDVTSSLTTPKLVTYTDKGLVSGGRSIEGTDLPDATSGTSGVIKAGTEFTVDSTGTLHHANSATPGTYTKVTVGARGHVTSGTNLAATDIPPLDTSKITTGTFGSLRIADSSISAAKLANYSTSYIQDTQPGGTSHFHGQLWLNPLAQQIRMWDGNVWVPIGVGALSEQNLRFCGLFDATNGQITVLTTFGSDAGFNVGDVIPTATEQLTGAYLVSETAGSGTGVTPGVTYDPGDWCLCMGVAQGWERIDTLNSGGGGGGSLDSLADVTITTPGAGQVLTYDGTIWVNQTPADASETAKGIIELATQVEVDTGTDDTKAVTPLKLSTYVADNAPADASETVKGVIELATQAETDAGTNDTLAITPLKLATYVAANAPTPADASETVKGIIQLATDAEVKDGTDTVKAVVPKTLADNYLAKNIATLDPLP